MSIITAENARCLLKTLITNATLGDAQRYYSAKIHGGQFQFSHWLFIQPLEDLG